jgi:thiamine biosynthesis lipoprotein
MMHGPAPFTRRELLTFDRPPHTAADHDIRVQRNAMACRFEVVLPGDAASQISEARAALDEADRLEAKLTVFGESSDVVYVNRHAAGGPVTVDAELFDLLADCQRIHADTDGAFDITSTPLSRCWGFLRREGRIPSVAEIDEARRTVGLHLVALDPVTRTVSFHRAGVELNLGAIGKGYALDCMAARLVSDGVHDAVLSAGGSSVLAIGGGRRGWPIDLRSKRATRGRLARVHLKNGALATSGAGEQYVDAGGRRYGHVIDPRTGWPACGLLSVTVVTANAAMADALSTAFLVGGVELGEQYCAHHAGTLAVLTLDDETQSTRVIGRTVRAEVEVG